jgi:hypothetical protein
MATPGGVHLEKHVLVLLKNHLLQGVPRNDFHDIRLLFFLGRGRFGFREVRYLRRQIENIELGEYGMSRWDNDFQKLDDKNV